MLQGRKMGANFRQKHQHAIFSTLAPMSENLMGKRGIERPAPNFGFRICDFGLLILDVGFWISDFGLV